MRAPAARPCALRTALIAALVLALLCGIALAVYESRTADLAGWFGGEERKEALLAGDIAPSGESTRLGDVVYTLDDVIYKDGTIYGSGVIRAAEGANIVLIDENRASMSPRAIPCTTARTTPCPTTRPATPSWRRSGEPGLILAKCVADGVLDENGEPDSVGYDQVPQPDGTIRFYFEFAGREGGIERAESYDVILSIANWEVTPEGEWLREDPDNTWLKDEWVVTVTPEMKERPNEKTWTLHRAVLCLLTGALPALAQDGGALRVLNDGWFVSEDYLAQYPDRSLELIPAEYLDNGIDTNLRELIFTTDWDVARITTDELTLRELDEAGCSWT